jgi:rhodanese-related sulfurtransferase
MATYPVRDATRADVERALREGSAEVINVLEAPPGFRLRLIRGSRNIPLSQLESRLGELDRLREIITYCAGPGCDAAERAAALLAERGYRVRCYQGGIRDWVEAGGGTEARA